MVWIDAADRRFRVRHAARLEVWAAREHARISGMAAEARAAFAEPVSAPAASLMDIVHERAMQNGGYVTPDLWAEAQRRYFGHPLTQMLYGISLLPGEEMYQVPENGSLYDFVYDFSRGCR